MNTAIDVADCPQAEYLRRLAENFTRVIPHVQAIGVSVRRIGPGSVECELPPRPEWLADPVRGLLNNGVVATLVDSAAGMAVYAALEAPERIATLDLRMDYLRPASDCSPLRCAAECFRLSRHIAFVRSRVWQDGSDDDLAVSHAAFMRAGSS